MSGHLRARLDGFLRSQDNDSVFIGSGEKHSLAFHAAELGGLQIGDHNDLPAHEFFRRVMISDTCAYLALFGSQVDLEHQQPIGVGMRLGGFDSCHPEFHLSKFINGDHPNLIYRACCLLQEDSRTCSSKKDFGFRDFMRVWTTKNNGRSVGALERSQRLRKSATCFSVKREPLPPLCQGKTPKAIRKPFCRHLSEKLKI